MDFASVANSVLLLVVAGIGGILITRRLDRLETKIDRVPTREEFDALVRRVDGLGRRVDTEFAGLRSDITQLAIALGTRPRPQTG